MYCISRKLNKNSFRQAILRKYAECKDVKETMEYFSAEGTNKEIVVIWALRSIGVDI